MSEPGWDDWVQRHAVLFCWDRPADIERLVAWSAVFARAGRTPAQMVAASEYVVTQDPPKFHSDHLRALRLALVALAQQEAQPPPKDDGCRKCCGTGRVIVPRPAGARQPTLMDGRPYQGTIAVLCSCLLGGWYFRSQAGYEKRRAMTLEEYARENPGWMAQQIAEEQLDRMQVEAANADRLLGAIVRRSRSDEVR